MFYMHDIGWGWWLLMSIGIIAFWALLIYGLIWLLRGERRQERQETPRDTPQETPQEILKRRLAAGEITVEEYEHLRETLDNKPRKPVAA